MRRLFAFLQFLVFYVAEILKSNIRVAHDVLTPRHRMNPGIIAVDLTGFTKIQILFMANFITMTPGTLGVAVSADQTKLFVHAMYIDDTPDALAESLLREYGRRVRRVF